LGNRNLLSGIEKSKTQPAWRLIFGLGILHVGSSSAQSIADSFPNLDSIREASIEQLVDVPDIGEIVAQSIHDFFRDKEGAELIERLRVAGLNFENSTAGGKDEGEALETSDKFADTTWVITGTLSNSTSDGSIRESMR
jgi:DNA ligase (NAD+)